MSASETDLRALDSQDLISRCTIKNILLAYPKLATLRTLLLSATGFREDFFQICIVQKFMAIQ